MDVLVQKDRKARKEHTCSLCGETIPTDETYYYTKIAEDGRIWEWKEHKRCCNIIYCLDELGYVDISDGYNRDDFWEACYDYCHENICTFCEQFSENLCRCSLDKDFCLDKIYEISDKEVEEQRESLKAICGKY